MLVTCRTSGMSGRARPGELAALANKSWPRSPMEAGRARSSKLTARRQPERGQRQRKSGQGRKKRTNLPTERDPTIAILRCLVPGGIGAACDDAKSRRARRGKVVSGCCAARGGGQWGREEAAFGEGIRTLVTGKSWWRRGEWERKGTVEIKCEYFPSLGREREKKGEMAG